MSIWYDGTNLNMYRGDSGTLVFAGLPACYGYRVFFSVKSIKSNDIIFEISGDPEYYYLTNDGELIVKEESETMDEFILRCEAMVESGAAVKRGKCKIFIPSEKTEELSILKGATVSEYYYGLKICFAETGVENTLIPYTKINEETGEVIFKDPPKLIVKPKYTEGIQPVICYDGIDIDSQNPKDYGLQPLLTPTENIFISEDNVIDIGKKLVDKIIRIDVIEEKIEELEERVTTNESNISSLDERVTTNESNISSLDETASAHQSQLNSHSTKIYRLEQTVGDNNSGLVKNVNDINTTMSNYGDVVTHNTSDFQATLTEGLGIKIENNEISVNLGIESLNNVIIEGLQDGDILMYSQALGKWINRPLS